MNLTAILREGSLADLRWYRDGMKVPGEVTFDPAGSKNPNNVKPEAQGQWGYGDISPIFDEDVAGIVDRHLPEEDLGDVAPVVVFARHMMNQGAPARAVDRELKARFTRDEMRRGLRGLRKLFAMDGIVGRVAVDATGYDSCAQALAAAENSPFKRYVKFVIGCSCGSPHMVPTADDGHELVASTGNPADDFLADEDPYEVSEVPHCPSTMLPLYAAVDDLDPSWAEDLMLVVENISGVPGDEASRIRMLDDKPIKKVQAAFQAVDRAAMAAARSRYSEPVDVSEHVLDAAENEVELFAEAPAPIEIDEAPGDFMGQEVPSLLAEAVEVDMTIDQHGTVFEGSDVIELEEPPVPEPELDVDMKSSIEW